MISKKVIIPVAAITIATATLFAVSQAVMAQSGNTMQSGLVKSIADKFHLDPSQVQDVFNQYWQSQKQTIQQTMQQREKTRLDNLVSKGSISSAQEQAILDEIAKLQSEYPMSSFKSMTATQRKQVMQHERNEITAWAQSQGIDVRYLMPFRFGRRGSGHIVPSVSPTETTTPTPSF